MRKLATAAIAGPAMVLACGCAAMLMAAVVGRHPMWPDQSLNLSEAAALRDEAEIMRLIGYGEDPNRARVVRGGFIGSETITVTPLEAGVLIRRAQVVTLLLNHGVLLDRDVWNRLSCMSEQLRSADVTRALDEKRPAGASRDCSGIRTP